MPNRQRFYDQPLKKLIGHELYIYSLLGVTEILQFEVFTALL